MARPVVLDTSALILASRQPGRRSRLATLLRGRRARLPSIVVTELLAGTRSREESASLERFFEYFVRQSLVLVPDYDDWKLTGRLISRRSRLVGAIRPRDHQNDVLIAILAARVGGTIYTANARHLGIWAEMLRDSGLDVSVTEIT